MKFLDTIIIVRTTINRYSRKAFIPLSRLEDGKSYHGLWCHRQSLPVSGLSPVRHTFLARTLLHRTIVAFARWRNRCYWQVRCHRATQLASGSTTAITPSNCADVQDRIRSWFILSLTRRQYKEQQRWGTSSESSTCRISSQLGQPTLLKSAGFCTIEQRRHARSWRLRAWLGMAASPWTDMLPIVSRRFNFA